MAQKVGEMNGHSKLNMLYTIVAMAVLGVIGVLANPFALSVSAQSVSQVATGEDSACAVTDKQVKCWGSNADGKLGYVKDIGAIKSTPVSVATHTDPIVKNGYCQGWDAPWGCVGVWVDEVVTPPSALAGKEVVKVSVGRSHACAIANARVYCWGDNTHGQLGDPSIPKYSASPRSVVSGKAGSVTRPAFCKTDLARDPCKLAGQWQNSMSISYPDSALLNKEIIDVSAGDNFTCALASDGTVSCWGEGDNGRLGTNSTADKSTPTAIYTSGAMNGKKAVRLAKAAGSTMCALVVNGQGNNTNGVPYCWGYGIDNGSSIPGNSKSSTACNKNSPTSKPSGSSSTKISESAKPVLVSGAAIVSMDGDDYVTGLGSDSKAYYWGQYGYRQDVTYTNVRTCRVDCNGKVVIQQQAKNKIVLAANTGGLNNSGSKNKKNGPGQGFNGKPGMATHTQYSGNSNSSSNVCTVRVHYGFTKNLTNTEVGKKVTTTPPTWPQSQAGITVFSGDTYGDATHAGLFCAVIGGVSRCDAHGGNTKSGQVGNGSNSQVSGPQNVVANGWLAGKQVTQLSTGKTGYTCAVASGSVGCWGVNTKGQLGVGDTASKNVPTKVGI